MMNYQVLKREAVYLDVFVSDRVRRQTARQIDRQTDRQPMGFSSTDRHRSAKKRERSLPEKYIWWQKSGIFSDSFRIISLGTYMIVFYLSVIQFFPIFCDPPVFSIFFKHFRPGVS